MSLKSINDECIRRLEDAARRINGGKGKELPPLKDESSEETVERQSPVQDYHTAFSELCQAQESNLMRDIETWISGFIEDVYNNQSEDWQHGFDTGEKLYELRMLIRRTKGDSV